MSEPLPLSKLHEAVLNFLKGRNDAVVFGATAVNAYVSEPRMTQDIDLMSPRAAELSEELRAHLSNQFHIAVRVRVIGDGKGYRLFQIQKSGNRHLVDVRAVEKLPQALRVSDVPIISAPDLIARKVISFQSRRGQPKSGTDWRDIAMLLLTFPELKVENGAVSKALEELGASSEILDEWRQLVSQEITMSNDEDEFS